MVDLYSRRGLLKVAVAALPAAALRMKLERRGGNLIETSGEDRSMNQQSSRGNSEVITDQFPSHPAELVREMVTVAHYDLKRVKELADTRPSLARAAWDWGFGDWEDALGATSHMGNRAVAEYLISKGARPSIFSAAMLGELDVVKGFIAAQPGAQAIRGPHSISLLAHARVGGKAARPVFEYLKGLADSDIEAPVTLTEEETNALVGTYVFGVGISQNIVVDANLKMYAGSKMYTHAPQLNWTREGTMPRPLFHLGDRTFYPAGAPAARIEFSRDADGALMTVTDGNLALSARLKA
jgi:hypothetical protein